MSKEYIGITIGPIMDTINLSSSPCALWASSYIFSYISKSLCEKIAEKVGSQRIITPNFSCFQGAEKTDSETGTKLENAFKSGVGLFHDRVIFEKPKDFKLNTISHIKDDVLEDINTRFQINDIEYLKQYIMIAATEYSAENPILDGGIILDSLELSKPFVFEEKSNPVLELFTGGRNDKNKRIKEVVKGLGLKGWQLNKSDENSASSDGSDEEYGIKDIGSIAHSDKSDKKYNNYYAVIRADGDNMSKIISGLKSISDFSKFSETCLAYCADVSDIVKTFGGVTIYAGGDDLLALIPCKGKSGTVFNLTESINKCFNSRFSDYIEKINKENDGRPEKEKIPVPSLSYGILICFKKYPLYEALTQSAGLLFGDAKSKKNCSVIKLIKHSGQSVKIRVPNCQIDTVLKLQDKILEETDDVLTSALHKIATFETLFNLADKSTIHNVFKNTFDADFHNGNDFVKKDLPNYFTKTVLGDADEQESAQLVSDLQNKNNPATSFSSLLRIMKFYVERSKKNG